MKTGAVFLDRDGVINAYVYNPEFGTVDSPAHPDEFVLLPGVAGAIAELNAIGLPVIVVSNQPGIAKGKFSSALLSAMTEKMHAQTRMEGGAFDAIYYCLHHPQSQLPEYKVNCDCRKPSPGLHLKKYVCQCLTEPERRAARPHRQARVRAAPASASSCPRRSGPARSSP